jgi:hypothetical protein
MNKFEIPSYNEIEAFILKWTFISVFIGILFIFTLKILFLFSTYISTGKIFADLGWFIWETIKSVPNRVLPF